jgi:hypothetical protein
MELPISSQLVLDRRHNCSENHFNEEIKYNSINLLTIYWDSIFDSIKLLNRYWRRIFAIGSAGSSVT